MSYIELKNPKTEKYSELVELIKSEKFPWYFDKSVGPCCQNKNTPWYSHCVLSRPLNIDCKSKILSSTFDEYFKDVLTEIFNFNSIKVDRLYRVNINATHSFSDMIAPIHVDHSFKHQQLIIYLNNLESECPTYLFKQKWKDGDLDVYPQTTLEKCLNNFDIDAIINPEEDKIILFDGLTYHSYGFPKNKNERRLCIVVTYCSL